MKNHYQREHIATRFLHSFERSLLSTDEKFWDYVDGARKHLQTNDAEIAYVSMAGIAKELSTKKNIVEAMLGHPMVTQSLDYSDIATRNAKWQNAVHALGYHIASLGAFRTTKQVITLDPLMEKEMAERAIPSDLRANELQKLPSWAFFIELNTDDWRPRNLRGIAGLFVSLIKDEDDLILKVTALDKARGGATPKTSLSVEMMLHSESSIAKIIDNVSHEGVSAMDNRKEIKRAMLKIATNVSLQLCSQTKENTLEPNQLGYFKSPEKINITLLSMPKKAANAARALDFVDSQSAISYAPTMK